MSPSQLTAHLTQSLPKRRKTLIKGPPGVGKSDIMEQACAAIGAELILSHPAVSDPTDYKGMPALTNGGTEAHFLPFGDLNALIKASKPTVCFLDDIGQAPHGVQAALMQLILARRVNGHRISDQVVFVGATNDTSHRAGVNSILEPVKSRWDCIVELQPNLDDWCAWAFGPGQMPDEIIGFIRFRPELLCKFEPTRELTNSPSPRTVAAAGRWVSDWKPAAGGQAQLPPHALEVLAGAAGEGFAAEFLGFLKVYQSLPTIDQILLDPAKAPVPSDPATLHAVTAALVRKFTKNNARAVFTYSGRLPKEFEVCLVRDGQRQNTEITTTREFTEWAVRNASVMS
jgi:hypothetical protein